jgi:GTP-binding protein
MHIKSAVFITSSVSVDKFPDGRFPEYAFIGRSNVGKSSLINMLVGIKGLAKISATPGKTQTINHFLVNDSWYIADLPGYGYAKVSKSDRAKWREMIHTYLLKRKNLMSVFVLVDARLDPQENDLEIINWLGEKEIPFRIVFTKSDKQSPNKSLSQVSKYKMELLKYWEEAPGFFITSDTTKKGREEMLGFIDETNKGFIQDEGIRI